MGRFVSPVTDMKPNGHLLFFKSGTSTELVTFMDEVETIPNLTNVPVGPDGNLGNVFFSGSAKVRYFDQFNVQYAERDPVGGEKELGDFSLWDPIVVYDKGDFVKGSDGNFYQSVNNGNVGNDPTLVGSAWTEIPFNGIYSATVSYSVGEVSQTTDGNMWKSLVNSNLNNDPSTDDGTNWAVAVSIPPDLWLNESANFIVDAGERYQIDGSGGAVDGELKAAYVVGDTITAHNDSTSTNLVRLTNTSLTLRGVNGTITAGNNLILNPGETSVFVAVTTTILEIV